MGSGVRALMRRKQVDSERTRAAGSAHQLRKELSVTQLVAIGQGPLLSHSRYIIPSTDLLLLVLICYLLYIIP
jgi:cationic amino acid transporter 1